MKGSLRETFRHALAGLARAWRTERNLRIHAAAAVGVLAAILWLRPGPAETALLVLAIGLVVGAELVNTAVEIIVDQLVGAEHRPAAQAAKDLAAAGVLVAVLGAAVAGAVILLPKVR